MKKVFSLLFVLTIIFSFTSCGQNDVSAGTSGTTENVSSQITEPVEESMEDTGDRTPITLTINDTVLEGYLNDSVPAQSLIAQLPLTVTLNDSDNDFCGGSLDIEYSESDVTAGYKNGDLVFWTPANNFVIFVSGEENSANTGNLVSLGHITKSARRCWTHWKAELM